MDNRNGQKVITITGRMLRKTCIRLSLHTKTNVTYFLAMSITDLGEFIADLQEVNEEE